MGERKPSAATKRPGRRPSRREAVLDAAVRLFCERGFHATGIDDIGAMAGISGPAVYRHFPNKEAILLTAFTRTWERFTEPCGVARTQPPEVAIETLLRSHVRVSLDDRALVSLWETEQRHLPRETLRESRRRQADYVAQWVDALSRARPDLSPEAAGLVVLGTLSMLRCLFLFDYSLPRPELERAVVEMARRALFAAPDDDRR